MKMSKNYVIIEEIYMPDKWKVMLVCIMLNRTNYKQVLPVAEQLFSKYPTIEQMLGANVNELREILRPLDFYNRRTKMILDFVTHAYMEGITRHNIRSMPGIGQYAYDCYMILFEGSTECPSKDHALLKYIAHHEKQIQKTLL